VREHAHPSAAIRGNVTILRTVGGGGKGERTDAMRGPRASHKASSRADASVRFGERGATTRLAGGAVLKISASVRAARRGRRCDGACQEAARGPAKASLAAPRLALLDAYNLGPVIDGSVLPTQSVRSPRTPFVSADVRS